MLQDSDFIGKKLNLLTIIKEVTQKIKYKRFVECLCDCGNIKIIQLSYVRSHHTKSCGCYNLSAFRVRSTTHGMSYSKEYNSYRKMIERCYSPNDISYKNYGAIKISVDERWLNNFDNFISDMGMKPSVGHSLDRIDSKGNYSKENCRWATRTEQNRNKKNNVVIVYNGTSMLLIEWANYFNTHYLNVRAQMKKKNFSEIYNFYKNKNSRSIP